MNAVRIPARPPATASRVADLRFSLNLRQLELKGLAKLERARFLQLAAPCKRYKRSGPDRTGTCWVRPATTLVAATLYLNIDRTQQLNLAFDTKVWCRTRGPTLSAPPSAGHCNAHVLGRLTLVHKGFEASSVWAVALAFLHVWF